LLQHNDFQAKQDNHRYMWPQPMLLTVATLVISC